MKKNEIILLLFFVSFFFIFIVTNLVLGDSERFSILRPANYSIIEGEIIPVVVRFDSNVDSFVIIKNNEEIQITDIKGKGYVCRTIKLNFGLNEIVVNAFEGGLKGRKVESKKVTVFFRSDILKELRIAPPEFQKKPFHKEDNEVECISCHEMNIAEKDVKPERPVDSMCYPCHKKIVRYDYVHGPVARWNCLSCHERHTSPIKYTTLRPERELCFICHKEKKEEWMPKKYWHGPTATGKCSICHNPHASNNPFWLRKATWDLCVGCHEDKTSGSHVVIGFSTGTHPTKGRTDPLRYGKELTCASCHSPHASNSRSLFITDDNDFYKLCQLCHKY